jgi:hypothetical protein
VNSTYAGDREQAWRMYERLTGTPPSNTMLAAMTDCITNGVSSSACSTAANNNGVANISSDGKVMATYLAMKDPNFLGVVVKNMVMPWTNKDQTVFAPLNDAAATLIGLIRDGKDFRTALYGDVFYYDPDSSAPAYDPFVNVNNGTGTGNSSNPTDNNNYVYIEHNNKNMQLDANLKFSAQQENFTGMPKTAVAGVLTTRAMQRAFFYAGTNRAMLRFTFMNFMCNDFVQIKDVTGNPDRIRQDPSRSPGGDSSVFLHNCIGCHAGMDGLAGAFAYYNWGPYQFDTNANPDTQSSTYATSVNPDFVLSGKTFSNTRVMPKYLQNFTSFPDGYVTTDDSWINYWRTGPDANLGWGWANDEASPQHTTKGSGLASMGQELSNTYAFSQCQALTVYRHVCLNEPSATTLKSMVNDFKSNGFDMRTLFSDAAIDCSNNLN